MIKKKLLISFAVFSNFCCISCEPVLKPLWQEDSHFCHYRTLCIEGSISSISTLVKEAHNSPENIVSILDRIENEVINCKNSLGIPLN